ncbi:hypothetical protein ALC57_18698, partial [Trachymyrmex cornetzi]
VFKHAESKAHRTNMVYNCSDEINIIEKESHERKFCHSFKDEFLSKLRIFEPKFVLQQEKNNPNNSVQDVLIAQRFDGFHEKILKEKWQFLYYTSMISTVSSFLELLITITNPNISYMSVTEETQIQIPGN